MLEEMYYRSLFLLAFPLVSIVINCLVDFFGLCCYYFVFDFLSFMRAIINFLNHFRSYMKLEKCTSLSFIFG